MRTCYAENPCESFCVPARCTEHRSLAVMCKSCQIASCVILEQINEQGGANALSFRTVYKLM